MRIGVFGGAFNPVHLGHLKLARCYIESLSLDKLIVVPTANPPHKSADRLASEEDRFNMLSLAFESEENVEISNIEFHRDGKSYTFYTIEELKKIYRGAELFLIIGSDQFLSFDRWYRYEELLESVTLCTAAREKNKRDELVEFSKTLPCGKNCFIADFEPIVISSSEIRSMIKAGQDASPYILKKVYDYITQKGLYGV